MPDEKKPAVGFALNSVNLVDTAKVVLYNPATDEPYLTPEGDEVYIEVYGQDSKHYRDVAHDQQNRRIQRAARSGGNVSITAQQIEANATELLVKCTKSWFGIGDEKGELLPCNEKNVRMLYDSQPHIRDQIDQGLHQRRNFLQNSSGA